MKAKKCQIPSQSLIHSLIPADYSDCFMTESDMDITCCADDIMISFWTDTPAWVSYLFKLRNFLVRFVGLKGGEGPSANELEQAIRSGEATGLMRTVAKNVNETAVVLKDKHLDAYISVRVEGRKVWITTLVKYQNMLGKVYFFFVRPFHSLIVKRMLIQALNNLSRKLT